VTAWLRCRVGSGLAPLRCAREAEEGQRSGRADVRDLPQAAQAGSADREGEVREDLSRYLPRAGCPRRQSGRDRRNAATSGQSAAALPEARGACAAPSWTRGCEAGRRDVLRGEQAGRARWGDLPLAEGVGLAARRFSVTGRPRTALTCTTRPRPPRRWPGLVLPGRG
jgi:hypothetical protein